MGLNLRSLSHHVTFHQSEVDIAWRSVPWLNRDEEMVNVMVVEANQQRKLRGVFSTYRANVPQYFIDVDRVKAKNLQVPLSELFNTLQAQMGSLYINDFNKFGQTYQVIMQAESRFRSDLDDLDQFYVRSSRGEMVPLSTLVTTRPVLGPDVAPRYNLYRAASVRASTAPGFSSGEAMAAFEDLAVSDGDAIEVPLQDALDVGANLLLVLHRAARDARRTEAVV